MFFSFVAIQFQKKLQFLKKKSSNAKKSSMKKICIVFILFVCAVLWFSWIMKMMKLTMHLHAFCSNKWNDAEILRKKRLKLRDCTKWYRWYRWWCWFPYNTLLLSYVKVVLGTFSNFAVEQVESSSSRLRLIGDKKLSLLQSSKKTGTRVNFYQIFTSFYVKMI